MWFAQLTAMDVSQLRPADHFILQRACFGLFQKFLGGCPSHPTGGGQGACQGRLGGIGEGRKSQSYHLEKAIAALARPYPVVLAGGIVPADGAGAFPRRGAPAGWGREATAAAAAALPHQAGGGCVEAER